MHHISTQLFVSKSQLYLPNREELFALMHPKSIFNDDPANDLADDLAEILKILQVCAISSRKQNDLFKALDKKPHTDTRIRYIDPLKKNSLIEKKL